MTQGFSPSRVLLLGFAMAFAASCASTPPVEMDFADIPSAEDLYHGYYIAGMEDISRLLLMSIIRAGIEGEVDKIDRLLEQ